MADRSKSKHVSRIDFKLSQSEQIRMSEIMESHPGKTATAVAKELIFSKRRQLLPNIDWKSFLELGSTMGKLQEIKASYKLGIDVTEDLIELEKLLTFYDKLKSEVQ